MEDKSYQRSVNFGDQSFALNVVRKKRKTLAIHVFLPPRPIEVRAPLKCSWREIDGFVASRRDWIFASISKLSNQPQAPTKSYSPGEEHLFLGDHYPLVLSRGRGNVVIQDGFFRVRCIDPYDPELVQQQLFKFYKDACLPVFQERLQACETRFPLGLVSAGLRTRKMSARWGSCSQSGEICLNTLLVKYPIECIDFVINHELCHLKYFAHNQSFYALLDETMPNWRQLEDKLKGFM